MANRIQIQTALQKPYDRILFGKEILSPVFGSCVNLSNSAVSASMQPNKSEHAVIQSVSIYGTINLEDGTEITCYEIILQPSVRIEHSKVAIQRYVRKLLTAGQIALVNFIAPQNKKLWRLTLVAKDSELSEQGIKEKTTHAKRYTYLLGPSETCKTAAERFETLSIEKEITFQAFVNAFSVEKLSKAFFDEYTLHYQKFCDYLQESNFRKSVFKITIPANVTKEENDKACKPIRDFVKKLLGRIVFLYFVQKKGWLGASDTQYKDGLTDFIKQLFKQSGGNDAFYGTWLTVLFFETLNKGRSNDDFKMPDGKKVKVPFLNGGLFDKEDHDEHILTFKSKLFHHPDFEDTLLTEKNKDNARGFLDFLDAFNFTVHEDSPEDHTVAVDPEMLGHIFENLLEDNKDKGTFYTPKEIVHYMCQESLTEYLTTHLSKEYTVYKEIGNAQVELFGNETKTGQLKMVEQLGDKALNRDDVAYIVKHKDISHLNKAQLKRIDALLNTVKICDPAIGSGAFPMGLLQEIHNIKEVIAYELQQPWKPADVKENIIQNSVYGVDIEKGAVDIARLRFWLSLVVDEEKPRALPNLDYKIVVGDSLVSKFEGEIIEIDWERKSSVGKADTFVQNIQRLLKEIAEKQKKFFKPDNKDKKKLQAEIRNLKLELLINQLSFNKEKFLASNAEKGGFAPTTSELKYNEELKQKKKVFDRHIIKLQKLKQNEEEPFEHFDWKLDFPEVLNPYLLNGNTGFDIIIGNPPWGSGLDDDMEILKKIYPETTTEHTDSFKIFMDLSLRLCRVSGCSSMIIPNTLLRQKRLHDVRDLLLKNKLIAIVNLGENIFEHVVAPSCIVISKKDSPTNNQTQYHDISKMPRTIRGQLLNSLNTDSRIHQSEFLKNQEREFVKSFVTISVPNTPLGEFDAFILKDVGIQCQRKNVGKEARTKSDLAKKIFIDSKLNEDAVMYWKGRDFDRYFIKDNTGRYFRTDFKKFIKPNEVVYFNSDVYNTIPKIIIRQTADKIIAAYDSKKRWFDGSAIGFIPNTKSQYHILYMLALLNSTFFKWYYQELVNEEGRVFAQVKLSKVKQIPVRTFDFKNPLEKSLHSLLVSLASYINFLRLHQNLKADELLMPTYFEQIVDGIVYELYFPDLIKKHKREITQHLGELPEFTDKISDEQKMNICKTVFNRLNDREHPVRVNLFYMSSIPEVAIIEGKNENN